MRDEIEIRVHGDPANPTLIYLPGLHGDWTLIAAFRAALQRDVRLVEFTYPRSTTWSLADYGNAVKEKLAEHQIHSGWLLGESFGSQVVWALLQKLQKPSQSDQSFHPTGVILTGGFARHPVMTEVVLAHWIHRIAPNRFVGTLLATYARYVRVRHHSLPEFKESICEFSRRRGAPGDREAILHRYSLIRTADFRSFVRDLRLPVYCMSGWIDPVVPWPLTLRWFRTNCLGFRDGKVIGWADHNALGTRPKESARTILSWMNHPAQTDPNATGFTTRAQS
jgi:pimeloyl-ACP methyl ester carboxylesterase